MSNWVEMYKDCAKAKELGAKVSMGINWTWGKGFTRENAESFVAWLDENHYEHRGIYSASNGSFDVRFR